MTTPTLCARCNTPVVTRRFTSWAEHGYWEHVEAGMDDDHRATTEPDDDYDPLEDEYRDCTAYGTYGHCNCSTGLRGACHRPRRRWRDEG